MIEFSLKKDLLLNQFDLDPLHVTLPDNFDLIKSYSDLCKCNLDTLKDSYYNQDTKCYILYILCQSVEILFKYLLILFSLEEPENIFLYEHHIFNMHEKLCNNRLVFDNFDRAIYFNINIIRVMLSELKGDKGKSLFTCFDDYTDLRYNHRKKSSELIIKSNLSKNDKKVIEEVIRCIEEITTLI